MSPHPNPLADLDPAELVAIYEARLLLEPEIVDRAARRFSEHDAEAAEACLERQARAEERGDVAAVREAREALRQVLDAAAAAPWLVRLAATARDAARPYRAWLDEGDGGRARRRALDEHRAVVAACRSGDGRRAAAAMHDHLARTANDLVVRMGTGAPFALRSGRCIREPVRFPVTEQGFSPVRPGVEGATVESDDLTITTYRYRAGAVWETHEHPEDQLTLVLRGDGLRFTVGRNEMTLRPGELALIPGDTPHSAVVGDDEVLTLNVWRLRRAPPR